MILPSPDLRQPRHLTASGIEVRWALQAFETAVANGQTDIMIKGPRGSGKTVFLADCFHRMAMYYPGMTQLWTRSKRTRLTDAVLKTFENAILGPGHPLFSSSAREHRHSYVYPNGSSIILQGLDDPERQRSVEADLVWVNEPTEISEEAWEEVGGSLRQTIGSSCPFRIKVGDHNPAPPGHWTNKRCKPFPVQLYPRVRDNGVRMGEWFTPQMYGETQNYNFGDQSGFPSFAIQTFHPDNPAYWDIDRWDWKPPGLEYVKNILGKMSGPRKVRYLEGRPAAAEGVVFIEFDPDIHQIAPYPLGIPPDWPRILAEDPGYDHPTAISVAAVAPNGRKIFIAEYVRRQTTVKQDSDWIKSYERNDKGIIRRKLGDPHYMFHKTKHNSGIPVSSQMREHGHRFERAPAASNTVELNDQVELVRSGLTNILDDGAPEIQVYDTCPMLCNAFQSWMYKRDSKGERTGSEDHYEEEYKDEMDTVRMTIASNPTYRFRKVAEMA